jgi:predicted O-methyltransferase YrrM
MCEYLVEKGYTVYVSEWHPIIRYGTCHDWRQITRYPCELADSNGWGNLLAFKNDPGTTVIHEALQKVLTVKDPKNMNNPTESQNVAMTKGKHSVFNLLGNSKLIMRQRLFSRFSSYSHFVEWVKSNSLALFRTGQFAKWVLNFLKRHPTAFALGLVVLSMLVFMPIFIPTFASYESYFWTAAVLLMLSAISMMGVSFGNKKMMEFVEREHCYRQTLRAEIKAERAEIRAEIKAERAEMLHELEQREDKLGARVEEQKQQQAQRHEALALKFNQLDLKFNQFVGSAPIFNFSDYQPFNRRLTKAHIDVLQQEWSSKLSLRVTSKSLSYLAHRIYTLESAAKGRLATTIEDAVLRVLVASAVQSKNLRVLEIGSLFGIGLGTIYDHTSSRFNPVHLTAIDPLDGYYGKEIQDIITDEIINELTFRRNLAMVGVRESEITLIKAMSTDAAVIEAATKHPHDVLIIDGDHSYDGVKADFVNYLSAVKRGGYIIFDDYDAPEWPDIKNFVDTHVRDNSDVTLVGASWRTAVFQVVRPEIIGEQPVVEK